MGLERLRKPFDVNKMGLLPLRNIVVGFLVLFACLVLLVSWSRQLKVRARQQTFQHEPYQSLLLDQCSSEPKL
jgi:hypothetical protein